ncbi:MAG: MBL fold metallo-hydrolase [Thermoguttaceae bacterium]
MPKTPVTRDITGRLIFLGTGTSHGVPVIGCGCPVCASRSPKNQRTRCGLILGLPEGNLLVDSPPELRLQLLREGIGSIHGVLYTHEHADHLFGLDDLRIFASYLGDDLPIYCNETVEHRIRRTFDYAFDPVTRAYPAGGVPRLVFRRIDTEPLAILGAQVIPIPLQHGRFEVQGYRVGNIAYCTDTNGIPPESCQLLQDLDVLILDALRHRPHATHFNLEEAIAVAGELAPRRTLFTHMSHDLDHETTNATLPPGMELAYDGMWIPLESDRPQTV